MSEDTRGDFPADCDAAEWGAAASIFDGQCRCLICARCGHHTGNSHQGHYWNLCKVTHTVREAHFCCPDPVYGCGLEVPESGSSEARDA